MLHLVLLILRQCEQLIISSIIFLWSITYEIFFVFKCTVYTNKRKLVRFYSIRLMMYKVQGTVNLEFAGTSGIMILTLS